MTATHTETRSLAGRWRFALDPDDEGVADAWYDEDLDETVRLPGTTDTNEKGERTTEREQRHLSRRYRYVGPAWYQRDVTVPESWAGKHVELVLERTRVTTVWVDDERVGGGESLCAPQQVDLSGVEPGEHTLTVRVDNDADLLHWKGVARGHMVTEETQTNWNGVLGDIELRAADPVRVADLQVYPDAAAGEARVAATVANDTEETAHGTLTVSGASRDGAYDALGPVEREVAADPGTETVELTVDLDADATWDEFEQVRYEVRADLACEAGGRSFADAETVTFGARDLAVDGTQLAVNGRTTFLRGEVNCCVFPQTGFAPMDVSAWRDVLGTYAEWGLNHVRFHSWCPPEAAFEAADELGIYLQPELPIWNNGSAFEDDERRAYFEREAERILDAYGNHPSFTVFSLGNELQGDAEAMAEMLADCRERDPRHLYSRGAYNFLGDPEPGEEEDLWVTASVVPEDVGHKVPIRGSYKDQSADGSPRTTDDYRHLLADVDVPVVTHEIGQFQVYPDFDETEKHTGVLEPRNFEVAADHLEAHGLAGRDAEFQRASGELAAACYREEVEATLRTPGLAGFQLLGLQDFPGQGTALVGLLDSHLDEKGLVDTARWRECCAPTVPLVRLESYTWATDETVEATVDLAHYGRDDLADVTAEWELTGPSGTVAAGTLDGGDVAQGSLATLGDLEADLSAVDAPAALDLEVSIPAADARNEYTVWAYPDDPVPAAPDGVTVRRHFDEETREALRDGEDVVLLADPDDLRHSVPGSFQPDFWSYALFKKQAPPGTLGLSMDADHPLFDAFPTPGRTDWQWHAIVESGRPVVLDDAPDDFEPIVRAVDNIERNQRLGFVLETGTRDGNLLVCAAPLDDVDDPAADQFRRALLDYAGSDAFDPEPALSWPVLEKLLDG